MSRSDNGSTAGGAGRRGAVSCTAMQETDDGPRSAESRTVRPGHTRRQVLTSAAAVAVGAATVSFVSGCGGEQAPNPLAAPSEQVKKAVADAVKGGRVQVGGGTFLADVGVVVTRPTATTYHAFSTACTHQGGRVNQVNQRGRLECPLHGSEFDLATGQAVAGPASSPLPGAPVDASGAIGA